MADFTPLSTNFQDDVLASSNSKRKYRMINNSDGTVSFEDATVYSQKGSEFGAKEVNEEREAINQLNTDLNDQQILIWSTDLTTNGTGFATTVFDVATYVIVNAYAPGRNNDKVITGFNADSGMWTVQVYDYNNNPVVNTLMTIRFFVARCSEMGDLQ